MKGTPSAARARGLALAAVRETFEETGLVVGRRTAHPSEPAVSEKPEMTRLGFLPALSGLAFLARAITPPGRPRRYDTRFFCVGAEAIAHDAGLSAADGELSALQWLSFEETRGLDLPSITRVVLEDLRDRIARGRLDDPVHEVPYYHHRNGTFRRDRLQLSDADGARGARLTVG
jgi:8-oxo-dGTP pyrophosphatase MutT (NUDIX family)